MKRLGRWLFNGLAIASLSFWLLSCAGFTRFMNDDDWAIFWSWNGRLYCMDSFEDTADGNAITIRQFAPWPSSVRLQGAGSAVETNSEIPFTAPDPRGTGPAMQVWVDANGQPVAPSDQSPGNHFAGPVAVTQIGQIPYVFGVGHLITAVILLAWFFAWMSRFRRRPPKITTGKCAVCSYDLRATPERCPECGTIPNGRQS
jgi:hypothetical protein